MNVFQPTARMWRNIIDRFNAHAKVVFFTATPFRCDQKNLTEDIDNTGLCYHMTRSEAIENRIIRDTNPIALVKVQGERYSKAEARQNVHMAILCVPTIHDAKEITQNWNLRFLSKAAYIHSGMKKTEQKRVIINRFENRKISTYCDSSEAAGRI